MICATRGAWIDLGKMYTQAPPWTCLPHIVVHLSTTVEVVVIHGRLCLRVRHGYPHVLQRPDLNNGGVDIIGYCVCSRYAYIYVYSDLPRQSEKGSGTGEPAP